MEKDNIIELNKDVEEFVIQASFPRSQQVFKDLYGDKAVPLEFVHTSDIHKSQDVWNRMVEYVNYYSEYISFILHTGDYCGGSQKFYKDLYEERSCVRPIYNCVGNHDCVTGEDGWNLSDKSIPHKLLFNHTEDWNVCFMDCEDSMSYYKDFPQSNLRMIVLDNYYNVSEARVWLKSLLNEALQNGIHVITAMHERTDYIKDSFGVRFSTLDNYREYNENYERKRTKPDFDRRGRLMYEDIIADFIQKGGKYICNLAGHEHHDEFGVTEKGVLNVVVASGTMWDALNDMKRIKDRRSEDCFNVVAVDTDLGLLKLIRIGANVDHYLRKRMALCFDYINKRVISDI